MPLHSSEHISLSSESIKAVPTYEIDHFLTPPSSSSSSQNISPGKANDNVDFSVCAPLVALAKEISLHARTLSEFYAAHSLPQPSFDLDGPEDYSNELPDEIQEVRARLRSATADMRDLAAGPKESIMWLAWSYHDVSLLHYISHFHIAEAVPLHGTINIEELASVTKTSHVRLKRMIRYLALRHVFAEPSPGRIAHTPSSRQLVTSKHVRSWVDVRTEETGPAAFGLVAALDRWGPESQELDQTAFSHIHSDGRLSRFDLLALPENEHREIRFANLMKALQATEPYDLKHTVSGYDWTALGEQALIVDIGGSSMAATAQALVKSFSNLSVVVQDLPTVVAQGRKTLPSQFSDRITFQEYDFLKQIQPVTNASAYLFRHILHDWSDKYAILALRNTVSVLQSGQKLIIIDVVMPAPRSVDSTVERTLRSSDMEMMVQFNALEREACDWEDLIKKADPRMRITNIHKPSRSANSVIEIVLDREDI